MAPGRGTGVRTGPLVPDAWQLLQRQQAAQFAVRQSARDAPCSGLERRSHADPYHRTVPLRPPTGPVEVPGHADHGQVPATMGPTGRPVGVHRAQSALHVPGQGTVEDVAREMDARRHLSARRPRHVGTATRLQRRESPTNHVDFIIISLPYLSDLLAELKRASDIEESLGQTLSFNEIKTKLVILYTLSKIRKLP